MVTLGGCVGSPGCEVGGCVGCPGCEVGGCVGCAGCDVGGCFGGPAGGDGGLVGLQAPVFGSGIDPAGQHLPLRPTSEPAAQHWLLGQAVPAHSTWHLLSIGLTCWPGAHWSCCLVGMQSVPSLGTLCFDQPA